MTRQLAWEKPSRYYMTTSCGRYNVAKASVNGVQKYTAWRNKTPKCDFPVMLGTYDKPDQAQQRCQQDADAGGRK